ncbi:MAG: hypothetical protein WC271_09125, partial [Bacteroidales bacterium]
MTELRLGGEKEKNRFAIFFLLPHSHNAIVTLKELATERSVYPTQLDFYKKLSLVAQRRICSY